MARTLSCYKISKNGWVFIQSLGEDGVKTLELCGWKVEKLSDEKENNNEAQAKKKNA